MGGKKHEPRGHQFTKNPKLRESACSYSFDATKTSEQFHNQIGLLRTK